MKNKNTNEYRDDVLTHLKYIKEKVDANFEHLERVNGRLNKAENNITAIKTIGSTLTIVIGIVLTWLGIQQ
tara:strand:+ start:63 stop:275 length:213 start_codon:yes stop_codon:yes gene_type:complete